MKQRINHRPLSAGARRRFRRRPVDPAIRSELLAIVEARATS